MNRQFAICILLFISILFVPALSKAYYESADGSDLTASIYPNNPGPNSNVSIKLGSYLHDLDACNMKWAENGQTAIEATGQKTYSFRTLPLGQTVNLSVSVVCSDGSTMSKSFVFQSNGADLLIAPNTYTPPFYRGAARATPGSSVRIVVVPQVYDAAGKLIDASNLIYHWSRNGKRMTNSSGYGKSTVTIQTADFNDLDGIAVDILSMSGEIKVSKDLDFLIDEPKVLLYERRPLLGIQYQNAYIGQINLSAAETNLIAEPFFMSNDSLAAGKVDLSWQMNGKDIESEQSGRAITLRQDNSQAGIATINVTATDSFNLMSQARTSIKLNFGQKSNGQSF